MKNKEMRKAIAEIMIKHNTDMYELSCRLSIVIGIDYITLFKANNIRGINFDEKYINIPNKDIEAIYNDVRRGFQEVHIWELTETEVNQLSNQIIWNSLYISDYENKFGVNPKEVCDFADGYLECEEDEYESFYQYIQSVEVC